MLVDVPLSLARVCVAAHHTGMSNREHEALESDKDGAAPRKESPRLGTLGGAYAPDGLGADLGTLLVVPEALQQELWNLIEPYLGDKLDDRAQSRIAQLARRHEVAPEELVKLARACRFLFRRAAETELPVDRLAIDLEALCGDDPRVAQLLLPLYAKALPLLRRRMLYGSVADHGNLATQVDWRLDKILSSQRAGKVDTAVALMTFSYRAGNTDERITLHMLPDLVEQLHRATSRILEK